MGKIKEFLKDWLVEHERLYWYIVVGLAVFAFGVITALGMAKLEKANASENNDVWATVNGVDMPDIRSFDWSIYTDWFAEEYGYEGNIGEKIIREHKYCIIMASPGAVDMGYTERLKFLFTNEPVQYTEHEYFWLFADWTTDVYFELENGRATTMKGYGQNRYYVGNDVYDDLIRVPIYSDNQSCRVWCANYDFAEAYPNDYRFDYYHIDYPVVISTAFFAPGPYLRLKDDYYYNTPYDNSVLDNESIAGVPMLGNCPVVSWKWIYKGSIGGYLKDYEGESTDIVSNTKVQCTLDVGIPSRAWVSDCMENLDVSGLRSLRTVSKRNEWIKSRFKDGKMEDCIVSFSTNLFVTSDNKDFELTFSHTDMLEQIREALGIDDWAEYYGVTDVQWNEFWSHIVFGYLTVNQMDSIVFNQYTDTNIMYGCYVSDVFTSGYNYSGYVYQDFFAEPQACLDAMKKELQEGYESVIAESEKKLEEYEAELESINKELEMLRADDTALFDIFGDLADSLKNATGGFRSLSVAVGNVFGFFPPEIMACLMFAFLAVLVIAVVKALRG